MPPTLALLSCFAFVYWVFRRDATTNPYPSAALWLPVLWMMRCGSRGIDFWFSSGAGDSGRWDPLAIAVLIILGLLVLARRPSTWGPVFAHNSAIIIFYAYLILSVFWVESLENPFIKILRPMGDLIMALVVVTEPNPRLAIVTMFRRTAILLIPLSIVLIKYFPALSRSQDKHWGADMWIGVTTHKNPLGQLCLVSALAILWSLVEARRNGQPLLRQRLSWLYLAMTAYLLNGGGHSRSSTSILCLILAVAVFLGFGYLRQQVHMVLRRMVQGVVALAAVAFALQIAGTSLQAVVAESTGKDATLSDRTYLWADVIRLGMNDPILGSGYGGFWVQSIYEKLSPQVDNKPAQSHNGYLETFANLGLVGVGLLGLVILQAFRSAAHVICTDFEYGRLRLALLFAVVVMNYSEATFPRGCHLWWFGFLVVAIHPGQRANWSTGKTIDDVDELVPCSVSRQPSGVPA